MRWCEILEYELKPEETGIRKPKVGDDDYPFGENGVAMLYLPNAYKDQWYNIMKDMASGQARKHRIRERPVLSFYDKQSVELCKDILNQQGINYHIYPAKEGPGSPSPLTHINRPDIMESLKNGPVLIIRED